MYIFYIQPQIIVRLHLHTDIQILRRTLLDNEDGEDERDNVEDVAEGGAGDE